MPVSTTTLQPRRSQSLVPARAAILCSGRAIALAILLAALCMMIGQTHAAQPSESPAATTASAPSDSDSALPGVTDADSESAPPAQATSFTAEAAPGNAHKSKPAPKRRETASVSAQELPEAELAKESAKEVEDGRRALRPGWGGGYPWYDKSKDELQRVHVRAPLSLPKWSFPSFSLGGIGLWEAIVWTVLAAALITVAVLLVRAYNHRESRRLLSATASARKATAAEVARMDVLPFRLDRKTSDLLGAARRAYQQGEYGEAIIYLYSHMLVELDRNQLIRLARGKTNRQYLREVRRRSKVDSVLEPTMLAFEEVYFGDHELTRQRFEGCWQQLDEFEKLVTQGAAA